MLVPRNKFGSSLFNVPLLLALRLFYHASPFDTAVQQVSHGRNERNVASLGSHDIRASLIPAATFTPSPSSSDIKRIESTLPTLFEEYEKLSTTAWLAKLLTSPSSRSHYRVVSLTWTKALDSPLSHEFIQFIIKDACTGRRSRLLTDRHVDGGDSVHIGWDWEAGKEPSQHHALPLPLLSLEFDNGPNLPDFARVLVNITRRRPEYSLLREMCWWHAEAVFEACHEKYGGRIKEWDFAHLRYSFVVRTNIIRREKLVRHAEEFRRLNIKDMSY